MQSKQDTQTNPGAAKRILDKKKTFLSCPKCKHDSCGVLNVQNLPGKKVRWRVCDKCGTVFLTTETITTVCENMFAQRIGG